MVRNILILGGSTEAYALARELADRPDIRVISSLAGRTGTPRLPAGDVRIGGFGGADGLAAYLRDNHIDAVVDCTHPFAARMGWNAAQGCAAMDVPLLRLERPAWVRQGGDLWDEVVDWTEAATLVGTRSKRVLMTVGRQELEPFAGLDHVWFLIRSVEMPDPMPPFTQAETLLARGPFTDEDERELLITRGIDTIVCKNSGGPTDAKLAAARALGIRVIIKTRPCRPDTPKAADIAEALSWLSPICA
ncbi:cobalt-precorrin-6A reductase [Magnetospirillum gryphiswaldense]|uniref:Precorrin-6x reductase CbiJ/CobK n=1 Tax=Magnetospirillum gryphiswaldense TaxID=55518 RepID=A4U136_9PROT|nr:cobalt-precorrin-6A reductase [Magnetospirillum gryphiswaldense]AVM76019.1 Precorrin-6A reductase [Magnetospirillum gryphiswaldense MSR-1]AVM79922.1 Precorrin-6A reductase [Magnetospirillum gryphiswaldense]CAM76593.1 Precorrin-6x reductase CbiJ/CobK [Magnetospirillum gryphiswaldense MSR-1]